MIVKCPSCGKLVPDKTGTCPKCGASLSVSALNQKTEQEFVTAPEPEPVLEPVVEPEPTPVLEPEPEPAAPVHDPVSEPVPEPTPESMPEPEPEEAKPEPKEDAAVPKDDKHNSSLHVVIISVLSTLLLASVIFVTVSFVRAGKSKTRFEDKVEVIESLLEKGKYKDARDMALRQIDEFKPAFMSGRISAEVNALLNRIDSSLDDYVAETVEMVNMMRAANRGRIDEYCWGLVRKALEEAPEDERLLQLRDIYIAQ